MEIDARATEEVSTIEERRIANDTMTEKAFEIIYIAGVDEECRRVSHCTSSVCGLTRRRWWDHGWRWYAHELVQQIWVIVHIDIALQCIEYRVILLSLLRPSHLTMQRYASFGDRCMKLSRCPASVVIVILVTCASHQARGEKGRELIGQTRIARRLDDGARKRCVPWSTIA
jgi:hypothetical protein